MKSYIKQSRRDETSVEHCGWGVRNQKRNFYGRNKKNTHYENL